MIVHRDRHPNRRRITLIEKRLKGGANFFEKTESTNW